MPHIDVTEAILEWCIRTVSLPLLIVRFFFCLQMPFRPSICSKINLFRAEPECGKKLGKKKASVHGGNATCNLCSIFLIGLLLLLALLDLKR
jgi:hypothetical protein